LQNKVTLDGFAVRGDSSAIAGMDTAKAASARTILISPPCRTARCPPRRRSAAASIQYTSKTLQSAFGRTRYPADEGSQSLPPVLRKAHPWPKVHDQRIAPVFQLEFESFGRKYCRTSRWSGISSCK
jgi:hypothetical protein